VEPQTSEDVSTKLQRIAEKARKHAGQPLRTLAHHIDLDVMREAFARTRKNGAVGIDEETATEFAANLDERLKSLLDRMHEGTYRAPPVRRVHIPKDNGKTRPIGIPTFEDKVLQRAVAMVLEAVYEESFLECSYGFRPERSAHEAIDAIWHQLMNVGGGWVLEADIQSFFDTIDHGVLRGFLDKRVSDGVLRRMIDKWLKAGVLEEGAIYRSELGTPQGGVISPLLANIYLHEVLDVWFEEDVKPRLRGRATLVRYADDFVVILETEEDARRLMDVLPKRFEKHALRLHPEKTKIVRFQRPRLKQGTKGDNDPRPGHFDFLGFTHYWGASRKGSWVVKRKTSKSRFTRTLTRFREWCRQHRHDPIDEQHATLKKKLLGHYGYFGVTGNFEALERLLHEVKRVWRYWLSRRSQRARITWDSFNDLLARRRLPRPRIVHSALAGTAKP
jgi:RNA-directed DNA polymerase